MACWQASQAGWARMGLQSGGGLFQARRLTITCKAICRALAAAHPLLLPLPYALAVGHPLLLRRPYVLAAAPPLFLPLPYILAIAHPLYSPCHVRCLHGHSSSCSSSRGLWPLACRGPPHTAVGAGSLACPSLPPAHQTIRALGCAGAGPLQPAHQALRALHRRRGGHRSRAHRGSRGVLRGGVHCCVQHPGLGLGGDARLRQVGAHAGAHAGAPSASAAAGA